jgi:hypothetical protein
MPQGFGSQGSVGPKQKRLKLNYIHYEQNYTASDAFSTKLNTESFFLEQKLLTHSILDIENTFILNERKTN